MGLLGGYLITICTEAHLCSDVGNPLIDIADQLFSGGHPATGADAAANGPMQQRQCIHLSKKLLYMQIDRMLAMAMTMTTTTTMAMAMTTMAMATTMAMTAWAWT